LAEAVPIRAIWQEGRIPIIPLIGDRPGGPILDPNTLLRGGAACPRTHTSPLPPRLASLNEPRFFLCYERGPQGLPTRNSGLAPLRGMNFCTRPSLTDEV